MKKNVLKGLLIFAGAAALWLGLSLFLRGNPEVMDALLKPLYQTRVTTLSESHRQGIRENIGVSLPESGNFVEGYIRNGRDPSYFYFVEFDLSEKAPGESDDAFLRRMLSLDKERYLTSEGIDELFYPGVFDQFGYSFTHTISCMENGWARILYRQTDYGTLLVGLCYGIP